MSRPAWHRLLAPLPEEALPLRKPVAPAPTEPRSAPSAIAGWEQLSVHLSAGLAGLRIVLVVLDGTGTLLSASDAVLFRLGADGGPTPPHEAPAMVHQESLGGRFEADGSFQGTHWSSFALDQGEEELQWASTKRAPSDHEIADLRRLVDEMIRRSPPAASS